MPIADLLLAILLLVLIAVVNDLRRSLKAYKEKKAGVIPIQKQTAALSAKSRDINELLKQAREYAKLAEKATPGPWTCEEFIDRFELFDKYGSSIKNSAANRSIVSASRDMVDLLGDLVTAVQELIRYYEEDYIPELLRQLANEVEDKYAQEKHRKADREVA